ncbi:MAG: hypothetical protein GC204_09250 [Chloroflexi bacterium]|nr:hypothetical protein [Chloroflexota bacterium]
MSETFNHINQLSDERLNLYRLAGKQHLNNAQRERITEITNQLEVLWDQYRRESVVSRRSDSTSEAA